MPAGPSQAAGGVDRNWQRAVNEARVVYERTVRRTRHIALTSVPAPARLTSAPAPARRERRGPRPATEAVLRPLIDGRTVDLATLADTAGLALEDVVGLVQGLVAGQAAVAGGLL